MINCLIIDDEQPAIDIIEDYIKQVPYLQLAGTATNPIEGLSLVNAGGIDVVFLDIHMPYLLGTDFVKATQGQCKIIFTTAHEKYALEGFEMDIIDYLLKPIPFARFLQSAQKAKTIFEIPLLTKVQPSINAGEDYIMLRGDTKGTYTKIELKDIDYIEATGNYVLVVCGAKKTIAHTKISTIENLVNYSQQFIRVHKSFIVNVSKIASIAGNSIKLKNNDKANIIIGITYKDAFLEVIRTRLADK